MKLSPGLAALPVDAWPGRRFAWIGGLLIATIIGLAGHDMVRSELDVQARVIAEQTTRSLQAVDTVLHHLAEQHRRGALQRLDPDELHEYLKEQSVGLVQVDGLVLFGADGRGLGSSVALKKGSSRREAMLDACSKRARPILMTTVAMGAGMLPIALKVGADADFRAPMAIAVIGGLITSTVLSLFYIPVVFTYVAKRWVGKLMRHEPAAADPALPAA